jgi:class 3 adenylate cyclase
MLGVAGVTGRREMPELIGPAGLDSFHRRGRRVLLGAVGGLVVVLVAAVSIDAVAPASGGGAPLGPLVVCAALLAAAALVSVAESATLPRSTPPWPRLPGGTVTFLFTDVEGSTRLQEAHPRAFREALMRHHAVLREAVTASGGVIFETLGDAVYAAFARPSDAVAAALAGQVGLSQSAAGTLGCAWPPQGLLVRIGLHTGEAEIQGDHYFGAALYRCARLTALACGGQVLLSEATAALVRDTLPDGAGLRDLGPRRLKDLRRAERVHQLVHPALADVSLLLPELSVAPPGLPAMPAGAQTPGGRDPAAPAREWRWPPYPRRQHRHDLTPADRGPGRRRPGRARGAPSSGAWYGLRPAR